jgi:thioredoxin-like negative regulator of GroEL
MKKLIYISAEWCGPCKMFGPIMNQVAASGIKVEKIDVDKAPQVAAAYNVRSVPTVVCVDASGNQLAKFTGVKSLDAVVAFYKNS